jgi:RIO-like serine/threonine protein kinase
MSAHLDDWVSKEEIRSHSDLKESTLSNAIKALLDRQIILPQPGKRGMYRLPMKSFAAWITAYTTFPGAATEE